MKITKFGHCCLLIEVAGKRVLTDPGKFTVSQNEVRNLDLILITHEHVDHCHSDSLVEIVKNNPQAKIVTNTSVGKILESLKINFEVLEGNYEAQIGGVKLEALDGKHVEIFGDYGQVQNTGYFIADKLFYPGDAYTVPSKNVSVLALPVAGPWCKVAEVITYALAVRPQKAIPVHDGILNENGITVVHGIIENHLKKNNIEFVRMIKDDVREF